MSAKSNKKRRLYRRHFRRCLDRRHRVESRLAQQTRQGRIPGRQYLAGRLSRIMGRLNSNMKWGE